MPRRESTFSPATKLAMALIARRGDGRLEDMASLADIPPKTLSRLERGQLGWLPSTRTLVKVVSYLGEPWTLGSVIEAASTPPAAPGAS